MSGTRGVALVASASALVLAAAVLRVPTPTAFEALLAEVSDGSLELYPSTTSMALAPVATSAPLPTSGPTSTTVSVSVPVGLVRVFVVGDSTSVFAAQALATAGAGQLLVEWAGEEACPFVHTVATRPASTLDRKPSECVGPLGKIDGVVDTFRPDIVLLVVGAMELMEHRYPGSDIAHLQGDLAYLDAHDRALNEVMAMLRSRGTELVVAGTPPRVLPRLSGCVASVRLRGRWPCKTSALWEEASRVYISG